MCHQQHSASICNHLLSIKTLHPKIQPARVLFSVLFPQITLICRETTVESLWVKNSELKYASVAVGELLSCSWEGLQRDLKQGRHWRSKVCGAPVCPAVNLKKRELKVSTMFLNIFFFTFFLHWQQGIYVTQTEPVFARQFILHSRVKRSWIDTFIQNSHVFLYTRISKERCPKSQSKVCCFALRLGMFNNQGLFTTRIFFTDS